MKPSRALDKLAHGMVTNPKQTIRQIASNEAFAHLGDAGPDLLAKAFGFDSLADVDVKMAEFKRTSAKRPR